MDQRHEYEHKENMDKNHGPIVSSMVIDESYYE